MDLKQLEYIVKIADERSITHAAEKLYLTQSALNQQLLRLEHELGAQLFYRTKSDWRPTPIGEVYLSGAREILQIKKHTYNRINDMIHTNRGRLSIGFTPVRGIEMFTRIYPEFHRQFPETIVEPRELSVHGQQELIRQGLLDIGFQTLAPRQRTSDSYLELGSEELLLIIPEGHPFAAAADAAPTGPSTPAASVSGSSDSDLCRSNAMPAGPAAAAPLPDADGQRRGNAPAAQSGAALSVSGLPRANNLQLLRYEPFVLMYRESTTRPLIDEVFRQAGFTPNVLFDTASNQTIVSMVQSRLCCGIVPWHYVKKQPGGIRAFRLPGHPRLDVVVSYQKNSYLSVPAKAFIQLAKEYWA